MSDTHVVWNGPCKGRGLQLKVPGLAKIKPKLDIYDVQALSTILFFCIRIILFWKLKVPKILHFFFWLCQELSIKNLPLFGVATQDIIDIST